MDVVFQRQFAFYLEDTARIRERETASMPAQRMEAPITVAEAILAIKKQDYLLPAQLRYSLATQWRSHDSHSSTRNQKLSLH